MCRPKDQGGLGIEVLDIKNRSLLSKWLYKLLHEDGVWHELLSNKYLKDKLLSQVEAKPTDSPFWKGLMKVKDDFLNVVLLCLGMAEVFGFGKTLGLMEPLFPFNIPFYITSLDGKFDRFRCPFSSTLNY